MSICPTVSRMPASTTSRGGPQVTPPTVTRAARAAARRERRRRLREAERPAALTCDTCGYSAPDDAGVVFVFTGTPAVAAAWSAPPVRAWRYQQARQSFQDHHNHPWFPDPDLPGWTPHYAYGRGEAPCGGCGRRIIGAAFCCDRCQHDATNATPHHPPARGVRRVRPDVHAEAPRRPDMLRPVPQTPVAGLTPRPQPHQPRPGNPESYRLRKAGQGGWGMADFLGG